MVVKNAQSITICFIHERQPQELNLLTLLVGNIYFPGNKRVLNDLFPGFGNFVALLPVSGVTEIVLTGIGFLSGSLQSGLD
jgi:hypothetical protein